MNEELTWFCSRGCNVFDSTYYDSDNPPECASCGSLMSLDSESYDDVHEAIEARQIAEFEAEHDSV